MSNNLTIADILSKAADILTPEGAWIQGHYARDSKGEVLSSGFDDAAVCFCALGALEAVTGNVWALSGAAPFLGAVLGVPEGEPTFSTIAEWNDDPDRTQSETVATLREAAEKARGMAENLVGDQS